MNWIVMVITDDGNKHFRSFDNYSAAIAYQDDVLDNFTAILFERSDA